MEILQNFWNLITTPNERILELISLPCLLIEFILYMKIFTTILKINATQKQNLIYFSSLTLVSIISKFIFTKPLSSSIHMVILPIIVYFVYKIGFLKSILAEIIPVLFSFIIELLIINLSRLFTSTSYEQLLTIPLYRILSIIVIYISLFAIYKLFKYKGWTLKIPDSLHTNKKFVFIVNFLFGIVLLGLQLYVCFFYSDVLPFSLLCTNVITLILYFAISFYNVYNTNKLAVASVNLEEAQLYNKTLSILHDNIRAFKHDFNNIVHAIGGYVQTNDMEGLKKYYSQLYADCTKSNNLTALSPHVINNPAVYNIFATKYYIADDKGIDINLEVFFDLNQLNMKIYEFTRILRNING